MVLEMLMNKAKRYSALFLLVSWPSQVQGNIQYLSTGRISQQFSVRLSVLRLSGFWVCASTEHEQGLLPLGHSQIPWAQSFSHSILQKKREELVQVH